MGGEEGRVAAAGGWATATAMNKSIPVRWKVFIVAAGCLGGILTYMVRLPPTEQTVTMRAPGAPFLASAWLDVRVCITQATFSPPNSLCSVYSCLITRREKGGSNCRAQNRLAIQT